MPPQEDIKKFNRFYEMFKKNRVPLKQHPDISSTLPETMEAYT